MSRRAKLSTYTLGVNHLQEVAVVDGMAEETLETQQRAAVVEEGTPAAAAEHPTLELALVCPIEKLLLEAAAEPEEIM